MDKMSDLQKKFLNINKFLFIYTESILHAKGFCNKLTLRLSVLIVSILSLLYATNKIVNCIDYYSFLYFLGHFLSNALLAAGSILLMLSINPILAIKAYWGYILVAVSTWTYAVLYLLSFILLLMYSPGEFIAGLFWNILCFALSFAFLLYVSWIDYCYAKHLSQGRVELVDTGRGVGLASNEQGPGMSDTMVEKKDAVETHK